MIDEERKEKQMLPEQKNKVVLEKEAYRITFKYDPKIVEKIRAIPGRHWHNDIKEWSTPANSISMKALQDAGFDPPNFKEEKVKKPLNLQGFKRQLYPFQRDGVQFVENNDGKALIADEMGLGKTTQALAYIHMHPELSPAVIICPASLKYNWEREAKICLKGNRKLQIVSGKKSEKIQKADIVIINYDIVSDRLSDLLELNPKLLVLDECHFCKNRKAKRTVAIAGGKNKAGNRVIGLSKTEKILALSGTPILNRPVELFPILRLLAPRRFPNFLAYAQRYCGAYRNGFGWDFKGATNTQELNQILCDTIMTRHLKADVLTDLPAKTRSVVPVKMQGKSSKEYQKAFNNFTEYLRSAGNEKGLNAEALVQFEILKQLAVKAKRDESITWIKDALDINDKILIFATHHDEIDFLMSELKEFNPVKIDGRDNLDVRQASEKSFQTDAKCHVLIGNIKAAGVGLNLTAASVVVFYELGWTPGEHVQAEDRAHRIGQKDAVMVYYLIAKNSIEEDIAGILDHKIKVLNSILDGKDTEENSLLIELLNKFKEK